MLGTVKRELNLNREKCFRKTEPTNQPNTQTNKAGLPSDKLVKLQVIMFGTILGEGGLILSLFRSFLLLLLYTSMTKHYLNKTHESAFIKKKKERIQTNWIICHFVFYYSSVKTVAFLWR